MRPIVPLRHLALVGLFAVGLAAPVRAGVVYSVEAAGVQNTTVPGVTTYGFDNVSTGLYTTANTSVGTFTAPGVGFAVVAPDAFGGSNQTRYLAVGNQSQNQGTATWTLPGPQSYAGFYWGAADALNHLDVYSGNTLLLSLERTDFNNSLGGGYFGNPNTGQNTTEPYTYFNFSGTGGTTFDRFVFRQTANGTGFEVDNFSILSPVTTAANPTPEPASVAVFGLAVGAAGLIRRRKQASA